MIPFFVPFFIITITMILVSITYKQFCNYKQGNITRMVLARNIFVEIFGILLAMTLAGLLGRYIAQIVIEHIINDLTKLIASILIGLLAGMGVGLVVRRTWGRVVKL